MRRTVSKPLIMPARTPHFCRHGHGKQNTVGDNLTEDTEVLIILCTHVYDDGLPIRRIVHEDNGEWQFLCGVLPHDHERLAMPMCYGHIPEIDWTCALPDLEQMPRGHTAVRKDPEAAWEIEPMHD